MILRDLFAGIGKGVWNSALSVLSTTYAEGARFDLSSIWPLGGLARRWESSSQRPYVALQMRLRRVGYSSCRQSLQQKRCSELRLQVAQRRVEASAPVSSLEGNAATLPRQSQLRWQGHDLSRMGRPKSLYLMGARAWVRARSYARPDQSSRQLRTSELPLDHGVRAMPQQARHVPCRMGRPTNAFRGSVSVRGHQLLDGSQSAEGRANAARSPARSAL